MRAALCECWYLWLVDLAFSYKSIGFYYFISYFWLFWHDSFTIIINPQIHSIHMLSENNLCSVVAYIWTMFWSVESCVNLLSKRIIVENISVSQTIIVLYYQGSIYCRSLVLHMSLVGEIRWVFGANFPSKFG